MSNYGVPIHEISFDLNDVVMDAATTNDRILAAIWVSFLPRNAELTRKALKLASESRVVALKTTFLLGGNPDPGTWDEETRALADECFDVCEKHDLIFHFHTSPGGNSDINNFIPLVEKLRQALQDLPRPLRRRRLGPHQARPEVPAVGRGGLQGLHRHLVGGRLRRALAADRDRAHRRRRRPRLLRLRRAVVGLRQRVLEDQRRPRTSRRSSRTASSGGTTRKLFAAVADHVPSSSTTGGCSSSCSRSACASTTSDDGALPGRRGGAGPSDALFLWVRGLPLTVPGTPRSSRRSPYTLRLRRARSATALPRRRAGRPGRPCPRRPKIYDMETADGIPYWKIALLHLDSIASTVVQKCIYWDTPEQCGFCGIELTRGEQTIPVKTPAQLAEVCTAARDLDGAVDVDADDRLDQPPRPRRALHLPLRRARSRRPAGCPIQVQFEPPDDLARARGGARRRRRRGRHPHRDVRPRGARARRGRQGAVRRRGLLPRAGSGRSRCSAAAASRPT